MGASQSIITMLFLIFAGAAILSTLALFTRQSLLVAYIVLGMIFGPWCLGLFHNAQIIAEVGDIGIIFLLFLLGLHLHPQNLFCMLKKVSWVALISSIIFALLGVAVMLVFGYSLTAACVVGLAMMFSSTIIGLKLLPTTVLHHQHTGELMISVLLMQDIIAIIVLLVLQAASGSDISFASMSLKILACPSLIVLSYLFQRFVLLKLLQRFDKVQEFIFLLSIGWCLGMAELAHVMGLSAEIGAFIAGVAIATHPVSLYIAESLKPLRDFFLIMFFFSIGAEFDFSYLSMVIIPAILLAVIILLIKPIVFRYLLGKVEECAAVSWEVGVRLGQGSEFSLLVVYLAMGSSLISQQVAYLVQAAMILSFIASCYIVVLKYPTPLALTDKMRKD